MKKVLVTYDGIISQIEEPGREFEIYEGPDAVIAWVDAPDNVGPLWSLEYSPKEDKMIWVEREEAPADPVLKRVIAYGAIGDQLDMLFKDITAGNIEDGAWVNHIKNVKETTPKPFDDRRNFEEIQKNLEDQEPSALLPVKYSSRDLPAWVRYPGWKGYQGAS
jgi:hypothetical protein